MDVMTLAAKLARLIDEKGLQVKADDLTHQIDPLFWIAKM
jgi:hypothetical protein